MRLIRGHWAIAHRLHWVKDVTFDEDYPSRAGGHAPVNWAILESLPSVRAEFLTLG
jgi:predicted transposase YbfD/YdcC